MLFLLITIGSHGDVHPFIGIGLELRRRGHRVTLATLPYFEELVRKAGLDFVPLGQAGNFEQMINDPDLWHTRRAFKAVFVRGALPLMEETYRVVEQRYVPGETVVVAHSLALGARIAHEKLGVPLATAHTAPSVIRTIYNVPKLPGLWMPNWLPRSVKKRIWAGGDRYVLDPMLAPPINAFRKQLGLSAVSSILDVWWHSPQLIIGMWPAWFAPAQPDWPGQTRAVGFPLYDEADISPISPQLDEWLNAGEPPIAFTPGTAMAQGDDFFAASLAAARLLKRRALLLSRHAISAPSSPDVFCAAYAPFSTLLPRCAALVHHAGIGTTAQCLRAGIPQLLMPMAHDQFDNALRLQKLNVGRWLTRKNYRPKAVAKLLKELLANPYVADSCKQISQRFAGPAAIDVTCDALEALSSEKPR